jgi:hypothetical protein
MLGSAIEEIPLLGAITSMALLISTLTDLPGLGCFPIRSENERLASSRLQTQYSLSVARSETIATTLGEADGFNESSGVQGRADASGPRATPTDDRGESKLHFASVRRNGESRSSELRQ